MCKILKIKFISEFKESKIAYITNNIFLENISISNKILINMHQVKILYQFIEFHCYVL